ncbi:MAG: hypothetical protein ACLR39_00815 [Oscillospiraceae bacterium]
MQENRSIAPGLGAFRLTLQRRENGFCGYVYSAALGCRAEFTSLARLIVLLEVDEHRYRQSRAGKALRCGGPRRCGAGDPDAPALKLAGAAP